MSFKPFIVIFFFFVSGLTLSAQGLYLNGGLFTAKNQYSVITPDGDDLRGFRIGADAGLNAGKMYFLPGLYYIRYSFDPDDSFFDHSVPLTVIKGRFGLGFDLIQISQKAILRAKVQGAIHWYANGYREVELPYQKLNEAYAGVDVGLGFTFGPLIIDVEYEKGVINAVNELWDSKFDLFYVSIGVFF